MLIKNMNNNQIVNKQEFIIIKMLKMFKNRV